VRSFLRHANVLRRQVFAAIAFFFGCVLFALAARPLSRHFVFPTHAVERLEPPADVLEWSLAAHDGVAVHALEIPGPSDGRIVIYFHNNRETMVHALGLGHELRRRGFGVVLPEYRGYGTSGDGDPSEEGLYSDAETVLERLSQRGIRAERMVLCGMSLGTGVAAEMARRGRGAALVLIAPYTSLPDLVNDAVPVVPARLLMPDWFDTLDKARDIRVPTLIVHGDADEIVPFWMGRELAHVIVGARLLVVPGGHHGDLFAREPEALWREIASLGRS
jgi:pimeloyl-ACP methyl ester carboxylesterase